MIKNLLSILFVLAMMNSFSQEIDRRPLRGQVIYMGSPVPNEYVINANTEQATITNERGEFEISVKQGDQLAFTAVNYKYMILTVSEEILAKNRLVVEVKEKVTELEEVVITPEQQERFLKLKNEEFKDYEYEIDRSTEVENVSLSQSERGMQDGINFANIFRAIFKAKKDTEEENSKLLVSEVLRQVYDDQFFVVDLKIPQDKIQEFLFYCDAKMPSKTLLKKENEFQLIDALVNNSKSFLKEMNEE